MQKTAIITDIPFWCPGAGERSRVYQMVSYLKQNTDLTVYFLGDEFPLVPAVHINGDTLEKKKFELACHLTSEELVIVVNQHLFWIADLIRSRSKVYLDAHDLISKRSELLKKGGHIDHTIDVDLEKQIFKKFDKVIFLQNEEFEIGASWIGKERCLLCPHPVQGLQKKHQKEISQIVFFASRAKPNIDGIIWFHDHVLPKVLHLQHKFSIYGTICLEKDLEKRCPNLFFKGTVEDLPSFYRSIDISIHPALYGTGLKIKNIEALSYGVPLVTTPSGAQGIKEHQDNLFLLAETSEEFAEKIDLLASNFSMRKKIGRNAFIYSRENWTPEKCFETLLA